MSTSGACASGSGACPTRTELPSARLASNQLIGDSDLPSTLLTHMVTQFGQFLDHDVTLSPEHEDEHCCDKADDPSDFCLPIRMSENDKFFSNFDVHCLQFTRSVGFCEENGGVLQQINGITSFVDGSNMYGSDDEYAASLRSMENGKLKVTENNLLPIIDEEFSAGDVRALEMPGLAAMHTLFVREHNRICDLIKEKKVNWNDEEIYQNARRIMTAEYQNIVYGEYLPVVLSPENLEGLELK